MPRVTVHLPVYSQSDLTSFTAVRLVETPFLPTVGTLISMAGLVRGHSCRVQQVQWGVVSGTFLVTLERQSTTYHIESAKRAWTARGWIIL